MKKRLFLIAVLSSLLFVLGGSYVAWKIGGSTSALDRVIRLHRIELLREGLYTRIREVQGKLKEKNTRFFPGPDVLVFDVLAMEETSRQCFTCHHAETTLRELRELSDALIRYETAISRVLTMRARAERMEREQVAAYREGEEVLERVRGMLSLASAKLEQRTFATIRDIRRTNLILYGLMAVAPLLMIGLSAYVVRLFASPVGALLEATRRLKSGDLDHRVASLADEFGELGTSFNEMAQALKEQMFQLQRTEQMMVCGQLATGIAHEIRNPISAIKVSLQVLADELVLSEEDKDLFAKVRGEAARIEALIKDLLGFARPREPQWETVDVNGLIERTVTLARQKTPTGGSGTGEIRWVARLDPALPKVVGDPDQLFQVFLNVVLNGIDAMPEGGTLTVETSTENGGVRVDFSDEGPGVAPELRDRIFEPFFTQKAKGTGLGLAISKVLVEKHGGTIRVEEGQGVGACFRVVLPALEEGPTATV